MLFFSKLLLAQASIEKALLIDDSPIKNLLNHFNNAIHPNNRLEATKLPYLLQNLLPFLLHLHKLGMAIQEFC